MLKLVRRKGSANWFIRGTVRGVRIYESTGTPSRDHAEYVLGQRQAEVLNRSVFGAKATATFAEAVNLYLGEPRSRSTARYVTRLLNHFKTKPLAEINQVAIEDAAKALYPKAASETRNRQVYTPISAIIAHAADRGLCEHIRLKRPKMKNPRNKPVKPEDAAALLALAKARSPEKYAFLCVLLYTGRRISEVLALTSDDVNMRRRWIRYEQTKTDQEGGVPMHDELFLALANMGIEDGRLWSWSDKGQVYRWLKPWVRELGIEFTPHMARHGFATELVRAGNSDAAIMRTGGWKDHKSLHRYTHVDEQLARDAVDSLKIGAKSVQSKPRKRASH